MAGLELPSSTNPFRGPVRVAGTLPPDPTLPRAPGRRCEQVPASLQEACAR